MRYVGARVMVGEIVADYGTGRQGSVRSGH